MNHGRSRTPHIHYDLWWARSGGHVHDLCKQGVEAKPSNAPSWGLREHLSPKLAPRFMPSSDHRQSPNQWLKQTASYACGVRSRRHLPDTGFQHDKSDHLAQALLFESGQAWEHFRHLENLVNQYLAFYGGVATAYLGIMGIIFTRSGHNAIGNALVAAMLTGPLVGTFGVAILARVERLRYIRNFYICEVIRPIRSYMFTNFAHDDKWVEELSIDPALERLRTRIKLERKLPYWGLRLGNDSIFAYIPLVFLGAPLWGLIASSWIKFSLIQYAIAAILGAYSLLVFLVMLDLNHLRRKGVFGD